MLSGSRTIVWYDWIVDGFTSERELLVHNSRIKTANIKRKKLLQAVYHWAVIGHRYTKTAKIKWLAIETLKQQISNGGMGDG